jgi:hypothetical protein
VRVLIPVGVGEPGVLCGGAGEVGCVGGRGGCDGFGRVLGRAVSGLIGLNRLKRVEADCSGLQLQGDAVLRTKERLM